MDSNLNLEKIHNKNVSPILKDYQAFPTLDFFEQAMRALQKNFLSPIEAFSNHS